MSNGLFQQLTEVDLAVAPLLNRVPPVENKNIALTGKIKTVHHYRYLKYASVPTIDGYFSRELDTVWSLNLYHQHLKGY